MTVAHSLCDLAPACLSVVTFSHLLGSRHVALLQILEIATRSVLSIFLNSLLSSELPLFFFFSLPPPTLNLRFYMKCFPLRGRFLDTPFRSCHRNLILQLK